MLSLHLSPKIARVSIAACILVAAAACNGDGVSGPPDFKLTPIVTFDDLKAALVEARNEANGGFGLDMWAAVVDRSGLVGSVVFTGATNTDQWPGSRVIAAQKANTANAFSLPHLALSTANLYSAAQPGGTLPLHDAQGKLLGGLAVRGDASCADHNQAWKVRYNLHLDFVPAGVADPTTNNNHGDDNIIYDINPATGVSASGFGHPECSAAATAIGIHLPDPDQRPIGH